MDHGCTESNETNNKHKKTYLEKVSKNQLKRRQETLYYLFIYLFIYLFNLKGNLTN